MVLSPLKNSDTSTIYLHYKEDCFFYKMVYDGIPLNVYLISMSCLFLNPHNLTIFFLQFLLLSSQACGIISWLWNFVCFLYLKLFYSYCTSQRLNVFIGFPREREPIRWWYTYLPIYISISLSIYLSSSKVCIVGNWLIGLWRLISPKICNWWTGDPGKLIMWAVVQEPADLRPKRKV